MAYTNFLEGRPEPAGEQSGHQLTLTDRKTLRVTGVSEVITLDLQTVRLRTAEELLCVRGSDLRLDGFDNPGGEVLVHGIIDTLSYEDDAPARGFFARLFG